MEQEASSVQVQSLVRKPSSSAQWESTHILELQSESSSQSPWQALSGPGGGLPISWAMVVDVMAVLVVTGSSVGVDVGNEDVGEEVGSTVMSVNSASVSVTFQGCPSLFFC